jgi:glycosyltransferase involved in cell wall biosynthesis
MSKPSFSVVAVVRNEAKCLPRLMASLGDFIERGGDVVIVDTGSTDDTAKVAREYGAKVTEVGDRFRITIDKKTADDINAKFVVEGDKDVITEGDSLFDFSSARNFAASLAENDMVTFVDGDEELTVMNIDRINELIADGFEKFSYHFIFSHRPDGSEGISFTQSKFYDRRKIKWTNIIHEYLTGKGKTMYLDRQTYLLEHWQNAETNRSGYLRGLALDCWQHLDYDRNSHYFAREMFYTGRYKSAIKEFERHISMKGWPAERGQSLVYIGDCYRALGEDKKALQAWHDSFELEPKRREALMRLAWYWYANQQWQKAAAYANAALTIKRDDFYSNKTEHYTNEPHEILYVSLWWLGQREASKEHFLKALEYSPNHPKYLHDRQFYGMGNYKDIGIEGWMTALELDFLHEEAKKHKSICEIGSWKGRSTHALLTGTSGYVTAVDHFKGSDDVKDKTNALGASGDVYAQFMKNVGHLNNLEVVRKPSLEAAVEIMDKYDMVFIDALHTYEGVKADIEAWKDKAEVVLCGHDYCDAWPEVKRAVDEAFGQPDEVHGSIWVKRIRKFPKVMHCIWVGDRPAPMKWIDTWKEKHPDWEHILWDNDKVFGRTWINQKHVDYYREKQIWHGLADVIRYEILHEYGGFLHAADSECLRPVDELIDCDHDAWGVYENEKVRPGLISPLYACRKGNDFAWQLIQGLKAKKEVGEPWMTTGNLYMKQMHERLKDRRFKVFPSYYFNPKHYTGEEYTGDFKPYSRQFWGSTLKAYDEKS